MGGLAWGVSGCPVAPQGGSVPVPVPCGRGGGAVRALPAPRCVSRPAHGRDRPGGGAGDTPGSRTPGPPSLPPRSPRAMKVKVISVLEDNYMYLVIEESTRDAVAVDAAVPKRVSGSPGRVAVAVAVGSPRRGIGAPLEHPPGRADPSIPSWTVGCRPLCPCPGLCGGPAVLEPLPARAAALEPCRPHSKRE